MHAKAIYACAKCFKKFTSFNELSSKEQFCRNCLTNATSRNCSSCGSSFKPEKGSQSECKKCLAAHNDAGKKCQICKIQMSTHGCLCIRCAGYQSLYGVPKQCNICNQYASFSKKGFVCCIACNYNLDLMTTEPSALNLDELTKCDPDINENSNRNSNLSDANGHPNGNSSDVVSTNGKNVNQIDKTAKNCYVCAKCFKKFENFEDLLTDQQYCRNCLRSQFEKQCCYCSAKYSSAQLEQKSCKSCQNKISKFGAPKLCGVCDKKYVFGVDKCAKCLGYVALYDVPVLCCRCKKHAAFRQPNGKICVFCNYFYEPNEEKVSYAVQCNSTAKESKTTNVAYHCAKCLKKFTNFEDLSAIEQFCKDCVESVANVNGNANAVVYADGNTEHIAATPFISPTITNVVIATVTSTTNTNSVVATTNSRANETTKLNQLIDKDKDSMMNSSSQSGPITETECIRRDASYSASDASKSKKISDESNANHMELLNCLKCKKNFPAGEFKADDDIQVDTRQQLCLLCADDLLNKTQIPAVDMDVYSYCSSDIEADLAAIQNTTIRLAQRGEDTSDSSSFNETDDEEKFKPKKTKAVIVMSKSFPHLIGQCTRCKKKFEEIDDYLNDEGLCQSCVSSSFTQKCFFCRAKFRYLMRNKCVCRKCQDALARFGTPRVCIYCKVSAAFTGSKCLRCSVYELVYGPPEQCNECKLHSAFRKNKNNKFIDCKLLCWLCDRSFQRTIAKATQVERGLKRSQNVFQYDQLKCNSDTTNSAYNANNTDDSDSLVGSKRQCYSIEVPAIPIPMAKLRSQSVFAQNMELVMQLRQRIETLEDEVKEKNRVIMEKDKNLTQLNSIIFEKEIETRKKREETERLHEMTVDSLKARLAVMMKRIASMTKRKIIANVKEI